MDDAGVSAALTSVRRGAGDFEPYAVGYVEFPEGILVEGRLTVNDPAQLVIGALMKRSPFRSTSPATRCEASRPSASRRWTRLQTRRGGLMRNVSIIGVGLHPFGRFGDKPALTWAPRQSD